MSTTGTSRSRRSTRQCAVGAPKWAYSTAPTEGGGTCASEDYQEVLREHGITCSMSRRGNCYDNAVMESWFSSFKVEFGEPFESILRSKDLSFDYIKVFYNQQRRHTFVGYLLPAEYERRFRAQQLAAAT